MELWTYFKEHKGFYRLMNSLKDKYISLGRYSGTVELKNLTEIEAMEFSKFFGKKIMCGENFRTSFSAIEKRLKNTVYEEFTWEELFTNYFGVHPTSKKDLTIQKKEEEKEFFNKVTANISKSLKDTILISYEEKSTLYNIIIKRYHKEKEQFEKEMITILDIVDNLDILTPSTLPLLASRTGNPHFLDMNTQNNNLFIKIISMYKNLQEPSTNQEKIQFFRELGIGIDDLSNYAITYLLDSSTKFIKSFKEAKEPLNINLHNLNKIENLFTDYKKVFVFENPSILSKLISLDVPIIITSGNPNYIVYRILDKLQESNTQIYYNGDFDPEGLTIANNLKNRYSNLELFCYDEDDYYQTRSEINILNASRLKKLSTVGDEKLQTIKNLMLNEKKCGYQENNIERIKKYILGNLQK